MIQKLGVNPKAHCKESYPVTANDIASKLFENSKADVSASRRKNVERELHEAKKSLRPNWNYNKKFTSRA